MVLHIDSRDLDLLLEQRRSYIGLRDFDVYEIVNAFLLFFSVSSITIEGHENIESVARLVFLVMAVYTLARSLWRWHKAVTDNFTKDMLVEEIKGLDMKERRSSIIAIRNRDNPRKLLVYYDPEWGYIVFPNYSTVDYANESSIREKLSRDLDIPEHDIAVSFADSSNERKYATAHKEERSYEYYFYSGMIDDLCTEDFEIDGREYRWMTTQELLADPETREHNRYIVEHVDKVG